MVGYENTSVNQTYWLPVDNIHTLYIEECGNPQGIPVVFLHGGPGGMISEMSRRFFNPKFYRIILFDQRGTGKSQPFLNLENNTIFDTVADIEKIRQHLKIEQWLVFGGSYGSTLALAYAIQYPERVKHLILRGIFLGRQSDNDWLFQEGASNIFPEAFEQFKSYIPQAEQNNLVQAYYRRMLSDDKAIADEACLKWSQWENSVVRLITPTMTPSTDITDSDRSLGLLEAHYFAKPMFEDDNYLLNHTDRLQNIPVDIVHGRYDMDCRPLGAYQLAQKLPQAQLHWINLGAHSPYEPEMFQCLVSIMDQLSEMYH